MSKKINSRIIERNGKKVRYTLNDEGEITEVCVLKSNGKPGIPTLKLKPSERSGSIQYRHTYDSFKQGEAIATTPFTDEGYSTHITYEAWRDAALAWFEVYLSGSD